MMGPFRAPQDGSRSTFMKCDPAKKRFAPRLWQMFFFVLPLSAIASEDAPAAPGSKQAVERIDRYLSDLENKGFCGVLLLTKQKDVLLHKAYGLADREAKRRATVDTGFCIGSIVKPITKAAIVKLESEGKLSLDDRISKYFADVPPDKRDITIRQLVEHTSGLPDIFGDDYELVSKEWVVEQAMAAKLLSKPGEQRNYSNAGYSLLGAIIEKVSGKPYERFAYDELFAPVGVKRIGYLIPGWKNEEMAVGYQGEKRWGTMRDHPWLDDGPSWNLRANGGMIATIAELKQWFDAVLAGRVLNEAGTKRFQELSLGVSKTTGNRAIAVVGGNGIFNALYVNFFEENVTFVFFTSSDQFQAEEIWGPIKKEITENLLK